MAEVLETISVVTIILAIFFLLVAIFFWFRFDIPTIFNDLTGRTAQKSIEKFRKENEGRDSGRSIYHQDTKNKGRPIITETLQFSAEEGGTAVLSEVSEERQEETGLLGGRPRYESAYASPNEETLDLLELSKQGSGDSNATDQLREEIQNVDTDKNKEKVVMIEELILTEADEIVQ